MQLWAHPLLGSLEFLLNICSKPVVLHYDTVFNVGDYYLSTLTFNNSLFVGEPIIPCAYLVHSRRYHSDHKAFLSDIVDNVPGQKTKEVNIITDKEFKFADVFPVGNHLFCWNHIQNDVHWYLKNHAKCTAEELNQFVNAFQQLIHNQVTEAEFEVEWNKLKNTDLFMSKPTIIHYSENSLIPMFKLHAAIWILKSAGISNPNEGVTNNCSESMNAVLHRLQQWKQVPLDVIAVSLYHFSVFYYREIERSVHQCGRWEVKEEYDHCKRDPSLMPRLEAVPDPQQIVNMCMNAKSTAGIVADEVKDTSVSSSGHLGLAQAAITANRVKLVQNGAWVVTEAEGTTPHAVTLFPKETCTCSSTKTCYHITACRLMVGLPPQLLGGTNIAELQRRDHRKRERPSGKKTATQT